MIAALGAEWKETIVQLQAYSTCNSTELKRNVLQFKESAGERSLPQKDVENKSGNY